MNDTREQRRLGAELLKETDPVVIAQVVYCQINARLDVNDADIQAEWIDDMKKCVRGYDIPNHKNYPVLDKVKSDSETGAVLLLDTTPIDSRQGATWIGTEDQFQVVIKHFLRSIEQFEDSSAKWPLTAINILLADQFNFPVSYVLHGTEFYAIRDMHATGYWKKSLVKSLSLALEEVDQNA